MTEDENGDENMPLTGPYIAPFLTGKSCTNPSESKLLIGAISVDISLLRMCCFCTLIEYSLLNEDENFVL